MHSRRIATFLLGAWIAGSVFMTFITVQNFQAPSLVMDSPQPPATRMIERLGRDQAQLFLRHFALEQTRHEFSLWERTELAIGLALGVCLFSATQKRFFPMILCVMMLATVLFELKIVPELIYQGRLTDFPPGNAELGPMGRSLALQEVYAGVEIVKLVAGGVLASFLFVYRTPRRSRKDLDSIDHPDHSTIIR